MIDESENFVMTTCIDDDNPTVGAIATFDGSVHIFKSHSTGPQTMFTIKRAVGGNPVTCMATAHGKLWCSGAACIDIYVYTMSTGNLVKVLKDMPSICYKFVAPSDHEMLAIAHTGSMISYNSIDLSKLSEVNNEFSALPNVSYVGVSNSNTLYTVQSGRMVRSWCELELGTTQPTLVKILQQRCSAQSEAMYELQRRVEETREEHQAYVALQIENTALKEKVFTLVAAEEDLSGQIGIVDVMKTRIADQAATIAKLESEIPKSRTLEIECNALRSEMHTLLSVIKPDPLTISKLEDMSFTGEAEWANYVTDSLLTYRSKWSRSLLDLHTSFIDLLAPIRDSLQSLLNDRFVAQKIIAEKQRTIELLKEINDSHKIKPRSQRDEDWDSNSDRSIVYESSSFALVQSPSIEPHKKERLLLQGGAGGSVSDTVDIA
eukprot:PhF_6_TR28794/c0_g2_i1/m.42176